MDDGLAVWDDEDEAVVVELELLEEVDVVEVADVVGVTLTVDDALARMALLT